MYSLKFSTDQDYGDEVVAIGPTLLLDRPLSPKTPLVDTEIENMRPISATEAVLIKLLWVGFLRA